MTRIIVTTRIAFNKTERAARAADLQMKARYESLLALPADELALVPHTELEKANRFLRNYPKYERKRREAAQARAASRAASRSANSARQADTPKNSETQDELDLFEMEFSGSAPWRFEGPGKLTEVMPLAWFAQAAEELDKVKRASLWIESNLHDDAKHWAEMRVSNLHNDILRELHRARGGYNVNHLPLPDDAYPEKVSEVTSKSKKGRLK